MTAVKAPKLHATAHRLVERTIMRNPDGTFAIRVVVTDEDTRATFRMTADACQVRALGLDPKSLPVGRAVRA